MKHIIIRVLTFLIASASLTGCLKGDDMNIDPNKTSDNVLTMQYLAGGSGSTIGSGLTYFGGAALTYPATHISDTATFNVALTGGKVVDKDVTITVGPDNDAVLDNFQNDAIPYVAMPDSLYHLISNTGTIKAGTNVAQFQIVFFPSKIDPTKNFMLPITVTDTKGYPVSANYGHVYFHTIGNPIGGAYNWDFLRYNNDNGSGTPTAQSFSGEHTIFAPVNPTSIKVPTGYFTQPNYVISFQNNSGVLSDFHAAFDPTELKSQFTDNGITVVDGPHITVSSDNKTFTIKYTVSTGTAFRHLIDKFYK